MRLFLEILFREPSKFFRQKNYTKFMKEVLKFGNAKRYKEVNSNFGNYKFYIPDALSYVWQFKEIFVDQNYKFNSTSDSPIIIDCGANIGLSVIYFNSLFPNAKILAFEPENKIFSYLEKNIKINNLKNIELNKKAVWTNNNGVNFLSEGADGSSIATTKSHNTNLVESIRLKELLENTKHIDFLKMDIEGAEYEVLCDCKNSLQNVDNIFIEYHSYKNNQQKLNEILTILTDNGFRYFIKPEADRPQPFINKTNKNNPDMDLQLNIFGYK